MSTSVTFTCITCRVAFKNGEIQRSHYKSDWHRYNLKRKVADLPPSSVEYFQSRVLLQRTEDDVQRSTIYCKTCKKQFNNKNVYDNHINSKKHKSNQDYSVSKISNNSTDEKSEEKEVSTEITKKMSICTNELDIEEVDSDEWENDAESLGDGNDCLFCFHHSRTVLKNVKHMSLEHSFFVPDIEYCIDLRGLICYLGEKIMQGNTFFYVLLIMLKVICSRIYVSLV